MSPNSVVVVYASCLTLLLSVAGAITFQAGQRQASLGLFTAAGCALVASVLTSLIIGYANAAQAKARAKYEQRYREDPQITRPGGS